MGRVTEDYLGWRGFRVEGDSSAECVRSGLGRDAENCQPAGHLGLDRTPAVNFGSRAAQNRGTVQIDKIWGV